MSISKKLSRGKRKQRLSNAKKLAAQIYKAELAAKRLKAINANRIKAYCECRVLPAFAFIMYNSFGWRFKQITSLSERFLKFIDDYLQLGTNYCDIPGLQVGLEDECRLKYEGYGRVAEPEDNTSVESWLQMYAANLSLDALEYLETVWLWVLHVDFGFGESRIKKCHEELAKIKPLDAPMKFVRNMMDILEGCKSLRKDSAIEFTTVKKRLEALDLDRTDFANGLVMIKRAC